MNEELLQKIMQERGISREQAILVLSEQNKIEDQILQEYTGKNSIGYRAPLDGSTMSRQQQAANALFPNRYGDVNYFAKNWNDLKQTMEDSYKESPYFVDGENNLTLRSTNPDDLSGGGAVTMRESREKARNLNREIRQEDLPYQKIKPGAFYKPTGQSIATFEEGGTANVPPTIPNLFGTGFNLDVNLLQNQGVPNYLAQDPNYLQNITNQQTQLQRVNTPQILQNNPLVAQDGQQIVNTSQPENNVSNVSAGVEEPMSDVERAAIDANKDLWKNTEDENRRKEIFEQVGMFNPYGSDIETELYTLGRSIGNAQNGQGGLANTISGVSAAGAALLGGTRSALSGYSTNLANNRYRQWMNERQRRLQYSPNSQTQNTQADGSGGTT